MWHCFSIDPMRVPLSHACHPPHFIYLYASRTLWGPRAATREECGLSLVFLTVIFLRSVAGGPAEVHSSSTVPRINAIHLVWLTELMWDLLLVLYHSELMECVKSHSLEPTASVLPMKHHVWKKYLSNCDVPLLVFFYFLLHAFPGIAFCKWI